MSRIKFILFWLGAFCITNLSFGQQATMPRQCTNPGNGFTVGGAFSLNIEYGCLENTNNSAIVRIQNPQAPSGATAVGGNYIFNLRDGLDIGKLGTLSNKLDTTVTTPGIYWIMQALNQGGEVYVYCKSYEIIKTEKPDIIPSSCGTNQMTVTFLNTANNKAHGKYRILWGDGSQDFIPDITPNSFPFTTIPHIYSTPPTIKPQIVGIYTRGPGGSIEACPGQPYDFNFEANSKPRINELEGLTGGTSNKITMVEGTDGKEYTLEQKPKTGNWADTGKKITRNTGETFKTETITGLNAANEYCFRLKTIDGCGTNILSNEVCTIIPKATVISSKEVKLDWTSPDPAVIRYSIGYKESPTGLNPNNAAPVTPTATTYTFDALDCKKQYDFQVTAYIGGVADRVLIKSPTILVNPATTPLLNAKTIATVSVQNENLIKFNIFEPDGLEKNYIYYRSEGGPSNFVKIKESSQNFYEDQNVEPSKQQYCYKVEYQDECDNVSQQSPAFCSVYLTSTRPNTLNWTQFVIPSPNTFPVLYYVEAIDETGFPIQADATPDNTLGVKAQIDRLLDAPNAQGKAYFRINAVQKVEITEKDGTKYDFPFTVFSNIYTFITPAQLYIPTAFSPNGDDKNDTFTAKGRYIVEFNLEVYDRWGNIIFESKDLDTGWNGTANDGTTPAPAGNYGFRVYGLDPAGQKFEKVGSVTLIR